jgi:hypothetical protein
VESIRASLYEVLAADHPMTVRQVFYRLVSQGAIAKTETEYKATAGRLLTEMRVSGEIPFAWIADNTRWQRKPQTYGSLEQALQRTAETYRRSLWDELPVYVEVWLEKDALAGVLYQVTAAWDVPLMVTRGYPSLSFMHGAAEYIRECGKPTHIYYVGDHDPSGVDIPRNVEARLREFAPLAEIHFKRVAVTSAQITHWGLPTRPTKATDSRSARFAGESVEVDAIPAQQLRALVERCITQHVDGATLEALRESEAAERETLDWVLHQIRLATA